VESESYLKRGLIKAAVVLLIILMTSTLSLPSLLIAPTPVAAESFSFGASGDIGFSKSTDASLNAVAGANLAFFLVVGDFSYNGTGTEQSWCNYITAHVGNNFPFMLEGGNHEDDNGPDGRVDNFVACLPNRLMKPDGSSAIEESGLCGTKPSACYAKEYYFDYPVDHPIARFILIGADNKFDGVKYQYPANSPHYQWLDSSILQAKNQGLWVIVGMHKLCISAGVMGCAIGVDLARLLINDKVDIVLQGHDHLYERSKQLTCIGGNPTRTVQAIYDPTCVANDGTSGIYNYGKGTIFLVNGQFGGRAFVDLNCNDPEASYFAKGMGRVKAWENGTCVTTEGAGQGFSQYTVTPNSIEVSLVTARQIKPGTLFIDHWSIVEKTGNQQPTSTNCIPLINCPYQPGDSSPTFNSGLTTRLSLAIPAIAGVVAAVVITFARRRQAFRSRPSEQSRLDST